MSGLTKFFAELLSVVSLMGGAGGGDPTANPDALLSVGGTVAGLDSGAPWS